MKYQQTNTVIKKVQAIVKKQFVNEPTGHDFYHMRRVAVIAKMIAEKEKAPVNMFVLELGALLHDIGDWKFHDGERAGGKKARKLLRELKVSDEIIKRVEHIIDNVSFKGAKVKNKMRSLEGRIVQDADRLDAIGAVGIARVFATGSNLKRLIHDPNLKPVLYKSFKDYKKGSTSINHFYEKLLLLKDIMNTKTGKKLAQRRHKYTEDFLQEFLREWG